jgi:Family of unknown function (DUF5947)
VAIDEAGPSSAPFLDRLRGLMQARPRARAGESCELCAVAIADEHQHLVNVESRSLLCVCRPCYLLFSNSGAGGGKYRIVPERRLFLRHMRISDGQWDALQIPVAIAFFFHNSSLGRTVAFYPSPAGATESLLPLDTWEELLRANPLLAGMAPDVEALLTYKRPSGCECYLVPIDACYELVGRIRQHWKGFQGGTEAWQAIDAFFAGLRARSAEAPTVLPVALPAEAPGEPCPR